MRPFDRYRATQLVMKQRHGTGGDSSPNVFANSRHSVVHSRAKRSAPDRGLTLPVHEFC